MDVMINPASTSSIVGDTLAHESSCQRCGGFLVKERCMDFLESQGNYWFWASRCIQCGDLIDEVTLRNRALRRQPQVIDKVNPSVFIRSAVGQAA